MSIPVIIFICLLLTILLVCPELFYHSITLLIFFVVISIEFYRNYKTNKRIKEEHKRVDEFEREMKKIKLLKRLKNSL